MKKIIFIILLFFYANVNATDVYVTKDSDGTIINLLEAECPYSPNSKFSLAVANIDGQKYVGCWISDLDLVVIIWNVSGLVFEQYFKISDFVLQKVI